MATFIEVPWFLQVAYAIIYQLLLFDNHLGDANSKIKEEYVKMAHILSFGTGRRRDVDNSGEHSPVLDREPRTFIHVKRAKRFDPVG